MSSKLEKNTPSPLYIQAYNWIKNKISTEWKEKEKLPNEDELAVQLGISRGTMRQAIKKLIEEGVLVQIQGKGTFVVSRPLEQPLAEKLVSVAEALTEGHKDFTTRLLLVDRMEDVEIASILELSAKDQLYILKRIRYIDQTPVVYLENYLPVKLFPNIEKYDLESIQLFTLIEQHYGIKIDWGKRSFVAKATNLQMSKILEIKRGTPVMFLEQVIYSTSNKPLEYSRVWIRNDYIKLTSILKRY